MRHQSKDLDFLTAAVEVLKSGLFDSTTKVSHAAVYAGTEMMEKNTVKDR